MKFPKCRLRMSSNNLTSPLIKFITGIVHIHFNLSKNRVHRFTRIPYQLTKKCDRNALRKKLLYRCYCLTYCLVFRKIVLFFYDKVRDKIIEVEATDNESFESLKSLPEDKKRGATIRYIFRRKSSK